VQLENIRCDIYSQNPKSIALTLKNLYCAALSYSVVIVCHALLVSLPHAV
jgi:hypothetical protein